VIYTDTVQHLVIYTEWAHLVIYSIDDMYCVGGLVTCTAADRLAVQPCNSVPFSPNIRYWMDTGKPSPKVKGQIFKLRF